MRGTRHNLCSELIRTRIIPAHAGNSVHHDICRVLPADHPRACGELEIQLVKSWPRFGSSPRMRGTRVRKSSCRPGARIIPAHAGNSSEARQPQRGAADHPRACGELQRTPWQRSLKAGSSPRMRGTHRYGRRLAETLRIIPAHAGNSRSSLILVGSRPDHPAHAGNSTPFCFSSKPGTDHPRACGNSLPSSP